MLEPISKLAWSMVRASRWQNAVLPDAPPHSIGTERFSYLAALSAQEKYLSGIPACAPAWPDAKIASAMPKRILRQVLDIFDMKG